MVWIGCLGEWKAQSQQLEVKYLMGRPNLRFMFFSCASEGWKLEMMPFISSLDLLHPLSITFPTYLIIVIPPSAFPLWCEVLIRALYVEALGVESGNMRFVLHACS
ncbi:unnamed protein product [Musa hybrid cultivar]